MYENCKTIYLIEIIKEKVCDLLLQYFLYFMKTNCTEK